MRFFNTEGPVNCADYFAVYANIEAAQALCEDVDRAMATIITSIAYGARQTPANLDPVALARQVRNKAGRDRSLPITAELLQQAKENLIQRRVTHLDQLADKLREPRVRRVVEAILVGEQEPQSRPAVALAGFPAAHP